MDIFTHLLIGATATSPFWGTHPLESVAFTFGSVAPDLDALSRQFGKVAYLRAHQTWTHAIGLQLALAGFAAAGLHLAELPFLIPSVAALALGAVLHSLLDWTNTYGVKLFAPLDARRHSLEWVFFIDAYVMCSTTAAFALQAWLWTTSGGTSLTVTAIWMLSTIAYFGAKGILRHRAGRLVERAVSLVPSALWPWRFHALELDQDRATTFTVDVLSGRRSDEQATPIHSPERVLELSEYRAMEGLSVGFVATEADDERVVVRDLRTRNFGTNFGRLIVNVSAGRPVVEQFDV